MYSVSIIIRRAPYGRQAVADEDRVLPRRCPKIFSADIIDEVFSEVFSAPQPVRLPRQ